MGQRRRVNGFFVNPNNRSGKPNGTYSESYSDEPKPLDIEDGLSNTWMVFEDTGRPDYWKEGKKISSGGTASDGAWADPYHFIFVEVICRGNQTINCHNGNEIYSFHFKGANFLFGDGSVRFMVQDLRPKTFAALYTRAGGDQPDRDYP
jgi:prepilin-type processing-associated H-X9-DG protein